MSANPLQAEPALTIYNDDFAVVREAVPLDLKAGVNEARYADMVSQLEPDSVILRDPAAKAKFQILEQSYRNDPVSQELLLSLFEGKTIDFFVKEPNKPDATVSGKIIRSGYKSNSQPVIEVGGKLRFSLPGQPIFPSLGDDTVLNPTLSWKIESAKDAKFDAELAYVTGGFSWEADYNLVAPEQGNSVDLVGWVTVSNESGKTFKDARVKLLAGDVNKIQPRPAPMAVGKAMRAMAVAEMAAPVTEKAFDEFHLYTLANKTTLRDRESKQVEFVRAAGVKMERLYVYDGAQLGGWRAGMSYGENPGYGTESNKKVAVYREFKNSQDNQLGIPLPKGRVRFYTQDSADQSLQFVGENHLDHTPKDETVRLYTGDSFDLVGERKRMDFKVDSANRKAQESIEIQVRNRKKEAVEIRVVEHLFRWLNWEIRDKSQGFEKKDAQTVEFRVALKPDEVRVVTYTVHYSW
ncbi:MAG: DUF4139 domain-containing protein [Candidatus Methylumidiphilus sp.]